ncbi:substrate-binding domain-containing protein [Streptomyces koelreuteriae]|uniref:substrate-binding domain-containing protein n=1 Tax=Streptomyces koelreuteriae TaxID=2838015 RepID=UPI003EBC4BEC
MSAAADRRREGILAALQTLETIRVTDLAQHLNMPAVTLRRDVAALAEAGLVSRSHGSVSLPAREAGGPALGLLVPTVGQYFGEVIAGARAAAGAAGAHLTLGISSYQAEADRAQVEQLLATGVAGLLLVPNWTPSRPADDLRWVGELPVPAVLVERRAPHGTPLAELDSVGSDHHHGVFIALRHLAALGHARVALAARKDTWTALQVRGAYAEGCVLLGLPAEPVIDIDEPAAHAEDIARQIVEAVESGVRGVLVHNDQDALQLSPMLRDKGLRIPEDIALVSYDDVVAALGAPPLTAVSPPRHAVGAAAVELILRRLKSDPALPVHHLDLLPELKVRASCGGTPGA